MKYTNLIMFALMLILLPSCKKDEDNTTQVITTTDVHNTVTAGTWRITYYYDSHHEETSNFSGYTFTFGSGNVLTATKAATTITGTWTTGTDYSKIKLILDFSAPGDFEEISDDWHVIERSDNIIKLQDVSGGNGGIDLLTFEKI